MQNPINRKYNINNLRVVCELLNQKKIEYFIFYGTLLGYCREKNLLKRDDDIDCYVGEEECGHEGYVMTNDYGMFKLVNREGFSKANFNLIRKW